MVRGPDSFAGPVVHSPLFHLSTHYSQLTSPLSSFYVDQVDQGSKKLPNLMKIKRLRWSALHGPLRTMGGHCGPGKVEAVRGSERRNAGDVAGDQTHLFPRTVRASLQAKAAREPSICH